MLHSLHVKNLALIDEIEIEFDRGLNILTGETGAGKSVLIGSINLALGEKAEQTMIRDGAESAMIEMTFGVDDPKLIETIRGMELPIEADGQLILQRRILPNRSVCKVCGESVTLKQLRDLAQLLINIHGQNDQQTLRMKNNQSDVLDAYAGDAVAETKRACADAYRSYLSAQKELSELQMDDRARQREMDLVRYEIDEIDAAALQEGEDERLEERFQRLSHAQKIAEALNGALRLTSDDEGGALELTSQAYRLLSGVAGLDPAIAELSAQLSDVEGLLQDATHGIQSYLRDGDGAEEDLDQVAERLNLINRLKEKYGAGNRGIAAIIEYRDAQEEKWVRLSDAERYRAETQKRADDARAQALTHAKKLTSLRQKTAKDLSKKMRDALRDLNFSDVQFEITVTPDEAALHFNGCDDVAFMVSTNSGERMRPLQKIASGGELSRIMLGLKTVLSDRDENLAMIFDEIDAGISGKTAWKVSGKLGRLAANRQVICITHLAQIAAMADAHFMIYKETEAGRSVTKIRRLPEEASVKELARLLGTDDVSDAALEGARNMRAEALQLKQEGNGTEHEG